MANNSKKKKQTQTKQSPGNSYPSTESFCNSLQVYVTGYMYTG